MMITSDAGRYMWLCDGPIFLSIHVYCFNEIEVTVINIHDKGAMIKFQRFHSDDAPSQNYW